MKPKVEFNYRLSLIAVVIILAVAMLVYFYTGKTNNQSSNNQAPTATSTTSKSSQNLIDFAQYLSNQGATLYGIADCDHCQNQKDMFGDALSKINYVDCGISATVCADNNIGAYPTWVIGGKQYVGEQSIDQLKKITNYNQ